MPVNSPDVPPKVRRVGLLIPIFAAIILFGGIVLIAVSHYAAKGPGPAAGETAQQIATGQTPPARGPYNLKDYSEPNNR
jgi:hypothetical protein